jgi:hypothetical protein
MSRLLSPQRLAQIARRWEANMDCTAIILPQTQVADGVNTSYRYPEPDESGLTSIKCRLQQGAPEEGVSADELRGRIGWQVQCPIGTRIKPSDRLYVSGVDADLGAYTRTLEVVGPAGPRTWEAVRILRCWEILPDTPNVEGG